VTTSLSSPTTTEIREISSTIASKLFNQSSNIEIWVVVENATNKNLPKVGTVMGVKSAMEEPWYSFFYGKS
jgi:hypothetical protein